MMQKNAPLIALALLGAGGCFTEKACFYPAPGQGSLVTNGERLGVAKRLSGDDPEAQSFVVMSVKEAYAAAAEGGLRRTIVQVTVNVVNRAAVPASFDTGKARLAVAGRAFAANWIARRPDAEGPARPPVRTSASSVQAQRTSVEVAPGAHVRFDLYFDLEPYAQTSYSAVPPVAGGIPLVSLREFTVSWHAEWAGEAVAGETRFVRDYTGRVGAGWGVAPGFHWGIGWYHWPYSWPTGIVVYRLWRPWRYRHGLRPWRKKGAGIFTKALKLKGNCGRRAWRGLAASCRAFERLTRSNTSLSRYTNRPYCTIASQVDTLQRRQKPFVPLPPLGMWRSWR